jgi:hypothetical protein
MTAGAGSAAPRETPSSHVDLRVAQALALGRVVLGSAALLAPGLLVRLLLPTDPQARGSAPRMFTRMVGVRDLALGLATIEALRRPETARAGRLLSLGAACDAVDGLATLGARAVPSRIRRSVAAGALLSAAIGAGLTRRLGREEPTPTGSRQGVC